MEIMNVVWNRGEATVADVWKALGVQRKVARSTVVTMLTRLQEKGWLCCDEDGHAFRYRAAVPREATLGDEGRQDLDHRKKDGRPDDGPHTAVPFEVDDIDPIEVPDLIVTAEKAAKR